MLVVLDRPIDSGTKKIKEICALHIRLASGNINNRKDVCPIGGGFSKKDNDNDKTIRFEHPYLINSFNIMKFIVSTVAIALGIFSFMSSANADLTDVLQDGESTKSVFAVFDISGKNIGSGRCCL